MFDAMDVVSDLRLLLFIGHYYHFVKVNIMT